MANTIKFVDLTLRDGQQSLAATRMNTQQAASVIKMIDDAGFEAMELWGGATLDSAVRFLDEDPWERLDHFYQILGDKSKIRALLRGQNLFAYQPFPDDLVINFIQEAVRSGVGQMRIFDALNDWRNLQVALLATKAYGARCEAAISYTTSPIHTTEYFVNLANKLETEGADQIAIKDMAGLLTPHATVSLIRGMKQRINVPITLHSHTTTGVATLNAILAMREGVDSIDTAITPFAGGTSHPPVELLVIFAEAMGIRHSLNKRLLERIQGKLFAIFGQLREFIPQFDTYKPVRFRDINRQTVREIVRLVERDHEAALQQAVKLLNNMMQELGYPDYDHRIFEAQIPGGMLTNLHSQLSQIGQLDKLDAIMKEVPIVRRDVGYVPLVTPTSQIVGSQATFNVMMGRYKMISKEFRMLLLGEFGSPPAPPNPEVLAQVLGPDEIPLKYRPASYLHPVLEDTYDLPFVRSKRDLLLHLMLKQPADEFLKRKYGLSD